MSFKVLHVLHWPRSGIGTLVGDLVRLAGSEAECHVIGLDGANSDYDALREGAASLENLAWSRRGPLALHRLWQRTRALQPEIIHTHSFLPGVGARLLGRRSRLLVTVHNAYPYFRAADLRSRVKRQLELRSLRAAPARVICVSEGVRAALPEGWPEAEVVENGVMVERVRRLAAQRNVRRDASAGPLLISAGRLEHQKGYDLLLAALALVRRELPARLALIGDGTQRIALQQQAQALGIADAVHFAGYDPNPFPYLRAADLYVSSSRYEGFGQSVLEAMCLGVPVVTTATAGMGAMLADGESGFLARAIDAPAIADAIRRAFTDRARLARVAQAGSALVDRRYHLHQTSRRYQSIYQEMLG